MYCLKGWHLSGSQLTYPKHGCVGINTIPTNLFDGSWLTTCTQSQKMSQYHPQLISLGRGTVAQTSSLLSPSLVVGSTRGREKADGEGGVWSLWQAASHTADSSVKDSCLGRESWSGSPPACASQPLCGGEQSWADWSDGGSVELIGATRASGWKIQAECKNTKCCQCYYHLH